MCHDTTASRTARSRHRTLRRRRFGHWLHPCCLHPHRISHSTTPRPPSMRQHTSPADSALLVADFLRALEPRMIACTLVAAACEAASDSVAPSGIGTRRGGGREATSGRRVAPWEAATRPRRHSPRQRCLLDESLYRSKAANVANEMYGIFHHTSRRTQQTWAAHPHRRSHAPRAVVPGHHLSETVLRATPTGPRHPCRSRPRLAAQKRSPSGMRLRAPRAPSCRALG